MQFSPTAQKKRAPVAPPENAGDTAEKRARTRLLADRAFWIGLLADVTRRRHRRFLMAMIAETDALLARGDETAGASPDSGR